jgi:deoxyribodipyrimidine photo-lyase
MQPSYATGLVWFRRDLRAVDNAALYHALTQCQQVHCVFVFDTQILAPLPRADRRVEFIRESLVELDEELRRLSGHAAGGLIVVHAAAPEAIPALAQALHVNAVFANHDDEPQALHRDSEVRTQLASAGVALHTFKDHTVLERGEVLTQSGTPYSVFTPYKNAWLRTITPFHLQSYPVERHAHRLAPRPTAYALPVPSLSSLGFVPTTLTQLKLPTGSSGAQQLFSDFLQRIDRYEETRNFPAVKGPSYLSVHLRFGTISPRLLARTAHALTQTGNPGAQTWLNELIWRDFYFQILYHRPDVAQHSFKPAYDAIAWEQGEAAQTLFKAWCDGQSGYPLVDAAMAQLNQTGYMHNRLRMVVASFLVKDLGIDWRWGERYFAQQLNDFDLAANNGGWQWASSSGCDAQPYFRIFNPVSQSEKFDPEGKFIRRYLPQLAGLRAAALHAPWLARPLELQEAGVVLGQTYPHPVVQHDLARQRTLERYAVVKAKAD